jgi:pimeloyl-ACP methyl ester carboxylesterase
VGIRRLIGLFVWVLAARLMTPMPALADSFNFPAGFRTQQIDTNGTTLHVRVGGSGPAVVLIHGYGETGDMWAPLAAELMHDHTVIAPDLRGMGLSGVASDGFTKKNQAKDIAGVMDVLHIERADVVAHDIGNMVAYAFAAAYPDRTTRLVVMDPMRSRSVSRPIRILPRIGIATTGPRWS